MEKIIYNTSKGPKAVGPYSTAVIHGNTIYLSGVGAIDPLTGKLINGTVQDEAHLAFQNARIVLAELGSSLANSLKVTLYLIDMNDFKVVNEVYRLYFGPAFPARTTIQAAGLPLGMKIEVDIIASI